MSRANRYGDSSAVSPVVGVLLLLALTVVLGVTTATFVSGLSDPAGESRPTVAFEFAYHPSATGSDTVSIQHVSGDAVAPEALVVVVHEAACRAGGESDGRYTVADLGLTADRMSAGRTVRFGPDPDGDGTDELCPGGTLDLSESAFRVVWRGPGGNTATLREWRP